MRDHSLLAYAILSSVALTGCRASQDNARATADHAPQTFAAYDAGAVPGGPGAHQRFGIGGATSDSLLTAMNHDVGADGAELPMGKGTVSEGAALFSAQCAMCHGKKGEGLAPAFPQLIGRDPKAEKFLFATDPKLPHTIGNYWPYATTLFDYIKRAMPLLAPGSLTDAQVYALSAYLLAANDVIADSATLDAAALRRVRMPYLDRFVPDDRKPGPTTK
jgi:cytochrome c